jgi:RNA polymerase sigma-70 factor (ECF subfamily)
MKPEGPAGEAAGRTVYALLTNDAPDLPLAVRESREERLRRVLDGNLDFIGRTLRAYGVSETDVDDGVQQVCLVLCHKLDRIEPFAERAFVFRTAQRIASRSRRSRSRRREVSDLDANHPEDSLDPERLADERQALDALGRILESLDEELREVFVLHEVEGLTMAAIAEMLTIAPGTVASRLRRARQQFEERVSRLRQRQGATST